MGCTICSSSTDAVNRTMTSPQRFPEPTSDWRDGEQHKLAVSLALAVNADVIITLIILITDLQPLHPQEAEQVGGVGQEVVLLRAGLQVLVDRQWTDCVSSSRTFVSIRFLILLLYCHFHGLLKQRSITDQYLSRSLTLASLSASRAFLSLPTATSRSRRLFSSARCSS